MGTSQSCSWSQPLYDTIPTDNGNSPKTTCSEQTDNGTSSPSTSRQQTASLVNKEELIQDAALLEVVTHADQGTQVTADKSEQCEVCRKQCVMCKLYAAQQTIQVALDEISKPEDGGEFCSCERHRHMNSNKYQHDSQ